jgi:hypothetical protein
MGIPGQVRNGVVVLEGEATLPEGTPVTVAPRKGSLFHKAKKQRRVVLPLVKSKKPSSANLTNQRIAELLEEDDLAARR